MADPGASASAFEEVRLPEMSVRRKRFCIREVVELTEQVVDGLQNGRRQRVASGCGSYQTDSAARLSSSNSRTALRISGEAFTGSASTCSPIDRSRPFDDSSHVCQSQRPASILSPLRPGPTRRAWQPRQRPPRDPAVIASVRDLDFILSGLASSETECTACSARSRDRLLTSSRASAQCSAS